MPKPKRKTNKGKKYQKPLTLVEHSEVEVLTAMLNTPPIKSRAKKQKAAVP